MRLHHGRLTASPTDLSNFLACRHRTALDRLVALGRLERPYFADPVAEVLRQRGQEHERQYVARLRARGLSVADLSALDSESRAVRTRAAMAAGEDVIVQAVLGDDEWLGYADVLVRVDAPSPVFGAWSYEIEDTKLARETRGGTILQLSVYSELVGGMQQRAPTAFRVVTPAGVEAYRVDEFGAFYRQVKARFQSFLAAPLEAPEPYPEPVEHCAVCHWSARCNARRRADDHLSFVANLGRSHQAELTGHGVTTMAQLAALPMPLPFRPARGTRDTFERLREQARLQDEQRRTGALRYDVLPPRASFGLAHLPEPRPGDLFLDLEGDPFGRPITGAQPGEGGREYLLGLGRVQADGTFHYTARWAFNDAEERAAFEAVIAEIVAALDQDPLIHVYHYAPYEPAALKRLMGRYASSEADLDRLLRGRRFVDLYAVVRHAVRAGVERYSIKHLEPYYGFVRDVGLDEAGDRRRLVEIAIETGDLSCVTPDVRASVEGYNRDDCRSTAALRGWLETLRDEEIKKGATIPRPVIPPDEPTENVKARQEKINALRARLLEHVPARRDDRTAEQQAHHVLAYLLDWHYREDKVAWWEYFQLLELTEEELEDEPTAIVGFEFVEREGPHVGERSGRATGSMRDRYRYPVQACEIRVGDQLKTREERAFGQVLEIDRAARTLTVKRGKSALDLAPTVVFSHEHVSVDTPAAALYRLGAAVAEAGFDGAPRAAADLLLRRTSPSSVNDGGTLAIQGPPGAGKTYMGAAMICDLVAAGKRVGVTATGHKVIRHLLRAVAAEAATRGQAVRLGHKSSDNRDHGDDGIRDLAENKDALEAIQAGAVQVLGGTAWMWAREEFAHAVDVLMIDEAGQMSLANALAVSGAASGLVLLGDPQQLEQPQRGSHPDGAGISALDYVLDGHQTMPAEWGRFLSETWRLAPDVCAFTSELFYEGKLRSRAGLEAQRLEGAGRFDGAGLVLVEAGHTGCLNASDEEAEVVRRVVAELLRPGARWIDAAGCAHALSAADVLVVAPYNAHVRRLEERVPGVRVGTVDKFQGQEAPVVIYSMATSSPADAPRGMEFLYSLNRLNVATSRARCVSIVVASPALFEPECRTPRQMRLANALARYREMARVLTESASSM